MGVIEVNKKVLGIAVFLMVAAMLATPVMAVPTKGRKAAITLKFALPPVGGPVEPPKPTGGVLHMHMSQTFNVELEIYGGLTYFGTATTDRQMLFVPQKNGMNLLMRDDYVLSFPDQQGGFEGNAMVLLDGVTTEPSLSWEMGKAHALFTGTGAFEGQTINAGSHWAPWEPPTPPAIVWHGYLLKP